MIKKFSIMLLALVLLLSFSSCFKDNHTTTPQDNSKVLATVDGKNITEQNLKMAMTNSVFTEKQMLEKLIDDQLLLIKAKELNLSVSDNEAKAEMQKQKDLIESAINKEEVLATLKDFIKKLGITDDEYWNTYAVQAYKATLTIGKTREKLGTDLDKTLKELRAKTNIEYFN